METLLGALPGEYKSGESYSDVLAWNHFGSETIPPRPVLRIAAENIINREKKLIKAATKNMVTYLARGLINDAKEVEKKLMTQLGRMMIKEARRIIDSVEELQENAEATIKKKGFNKPLYHTDKLEKHLGYEIIE